ncbi:MAG: DUF6069 family protein [Spirochaetota bacterium]
MTATTTPVLSSTAPSTLRIAPSRLAIATFAGGFIALALNLLIFFVVQGPFGSALLIPGPTQAGTETPLAAGMVIAASIVPAIGAAFLLMLLDRFTSRPIRIFQLTALVVGLLSLGGPLALPLSWAVRLPLEAMHVCTAAAITLCLSRSGSAKVA